MSNTITKIKIDGTYYQLEDVRVSELNETVSELNERISGLKEINIENGSGEGSVVQKGYDASATGAYAFAIGRETQANGHFSWAEGYKTISGVLDEETGENNKQYTHAEGEETKALGWGAHSEGYGSQASGSYSHAENNLTKASGDWSHAEGDGAEANGQASHAEGDHTTASGWASHSEGQETLAKSSYSHAEGYKTEAIGTASHAEGDKTKAKGWASHVSGEGTEANYNHQFITGRWNSNKENTLFEIGNGYENNKSNAFEVLSDGRVKSYGTPSEDNDLVSKKYVDDKHKDAIEVAQGKTKTYVLSTKATNNEYLLYNSIFASVDTFIGGDDEEAKLLLVDGTIVSITDLKVGDIILVTDLEYPDRYMTNYTHGFYFYPLEARKIDLSLYALQSSLDALENSINNSLSTKVSKTTTVNGHALSGNVTLTKEDIGLNNVDNTSDLDKPVSTATQGLINNLSSLINTNKENIDKIEKVLTSDDTDLDTLQELVDALKNNTSNINDIFTQISKKADKTTTINGHSLSSNVTITKEDIGLNNVLDVASYSKTETDALLLPKANRTEIPTKLSDLDNDMHFVDNNSAVTLYGDQTISGTKEFVNGAIFYGDAQTTQEPSIEYHVVNKKYVDNLLKNKADLVNGLIPYDQLPEILPIVDISINDILDTQTTSVGLESGEYYTRYNNDFKGIIWNTYYTYYNYHMIVLDITNQRIIIRTPTFHSSSDNSTSSIEIINLATKNDIYEVEVNTKTYVDQKIEEAIIKALNTEV